MVVKKSKSVSKIITLEDDNDFVNLLVYGPSGVGKTVFAGSADRVLFIAAEDDGTSSAKRLGSTADKWPVEKWSDIEEAYNYLYDNPDVLEKYKWIVIDSATEMQRKMLLGILSKAVKENPSRDPDIPAIQDHQKWQNMFKRFVQAFNSLPVNVLWTALVLDAENNDGDEFLTPDIQGKKFQMSQAICSYMTSYGYMEIRKVKVDGKITRIRRITWEDTGSIRGKDRTTVLAPRTDNLSLQEITELIEGSAVAEKKTTRSSRPGVKKTASTRVKETV